MANSVVDALKDYQPDADAGDTNQPINVTVMSDGAVGDLDGELRRLKSELRAVSLLMSWERWLGLKNLAASGNVAFTFSSGTIFTVNDDFLNANRRVAVVGRRVKAIGTGYVIYGRITASSVFAGTTTVTVLWDSGAMDGTLSEVQFGPEPRGFSAVPIVVVKSITESSGAALHADTELFVPMGPNEVVHAAWKINFAVASIPGSFRLAIVAPVGAVGQWDGQYQFNDGVNPESMLPIRPSSVLDGSVPKIITMSDTGSYMAYINGTAVNGATPGNLALHWAKSGPTATGEVRSSSVVTGWRVSR